MDLTKFRKDFPTKRQFGTFSSEELNSFKSFFPEDIIDFLKEEGKSSYGNDLLWIVSPHDYHEIFNNWGLDGDEMYALIRSSFGSIMYYHKGHTYILDPLMGENYGMSDTFDGLINYAIGMDLIQEGNFLKTLHNTVSKSLPQLKEDEMYTLVHKMLPEILEFVELDLSKFKYE